MKCPNCGTDASGKFCSNCGASLKSSACSKCGAPLSAGAKFCHACGTPAAPSAAVAARSGVPWFLVGAVVVVAIVVLAVTQLRPGAPVASPTPPPAMGGGGPVDLSQLSPRDAADRLFNRVMMLREAGSADSAAFFAPMALQAYGMLEALDNDARFHIGLIELAAGNPEGARAQADTIAGDVPTHLFAAMLRADAARARDDADAARAAEQAYLQNFDAEMNARRPEYEHHGPWLTTYRDNIAR